MSNPFVSLLHSRKFWLLILDTIVSLLTYFIGKYAGADGADMLYVIGLLQPVFIVIIGAIAYEDAAKSWGSLSVNNYTENDK